MFLDRIPIRWRLTFVHALSSGVLFGLGGYGVYRLVEHNLYQSVDAALSASGRAIRDARNVRGFGPPLLESFLDDFLGERLVRPYAQLVDLSGKVRTKTPNMTVALPVTERAVANAEHGIETFETFRLPSGSPLRQLTLPMIQRGRFSGELIQIGAPLDATIHTLTNIKLVLWIAFPAGLAISILLGYGITRRSLRPVSVISNTAARLGGDDLTLRLPVPPARDEIRVLITTFNQMLDRLSDAFGRLRRFSGDVSHELRTPLAVLRGEADLALRKQRSPEEYATSLKTIVSETEHMTRIIDDLLLLARAQSGALALQWETLEVGRFLDELRRSVEPVARAKNVQVQVEVATQSSLRASTNFLLLAMKNVVLNAIKHSPDGSSVWIKARQEKELVCFEIEDSGEGIAEKDLPFIFDPFYRADSARNRAAGGFGIGLTLARALISLHSGTITALSKAGRGAVFVVSIPIERT